MRRIAALLIAAALSTGCYHVTVITGAPAANKTIDKPWQMSFVSGLVPPTEITTDPPCTQGVARIETKRSFMNGVVSAISSSIVSPIHVLVTCASGPVAR